MSPRAFPVDAIRQLAARYVDGSPGEEMRLLLKVQEETGEAAEAYIGVTGTNPRKGVTHSMEDVRKELLDVAATALVAWTAFGDPRDNALEALKVHALRLSARHDREAS